MTEPQTDLGRKRQIVGWFGVVLMTLAAGFWAFWGTIEAFHEGWCQPTLTARCWQTLAYLSPSLTLVGLTVFSLRWPRVGSVLMFAAAAALSVLIYQTGARLSGFILATLVGIPLLMGVVFWWGRPMPRSLAIRIAVVIPGLTIIICAIEPVGRVSSRLDDGYRGAREITGNQVQLVWAPAGPGWSRYGNVPWEQAMERVRYLSPDGLTLMEDPQDIWRLPTRREVVHSLTRRDQNAGGRWNARDGTATYRIKPDKESPIWDQYASLIYLWTSESASETDAWIVVYHGGVFRKRKGTGSPSLGFRAVKAVPPRDVRAE